MTRASAQLALLDWTAPNARARDPDTSIDAANAHPLLRHTDRRAALVALYRAHPTGLSDFQLAEEIQRKQTSAGKRRGELRDLGLVKDSGSRRPSDTGSPSIVWCLTEDGLEVARRVV